MTRRELVIDASPQRSPEWFRARLGRLTGSRAADMLATIKSGEAAARRDYRLQLVCELLTGQPQESGFVNDAMQRGIDLEPMALGAYEALTGTLAQTVGFVSWADLMVGCSVDGRIGDFEGILELKCPKSATHLEYLRSPTVPTRYLPQITHNLWVTGAAWCDFLSYDDRFPAPLQTVLRRVRREDVDFDAYATAALKFLAEVDAEEQMIRAMVPAQSVEEESDAESKQSADHGPLGQGR